MPELPDLQVFSRNLTTALTGKKIAAVKITAGAKINVPKTKLQQVLKGQTVDKVERQGKELHFVFTGGNSLAMHLMLHGQLHIFSKRNAEKYTMMAIFFTDESGIALSDFQKAARITLNPEISGVPDALLITTAYLKTILAQSKSVIKKVLMDQKLVAGIGNAYADEIFWQAQLSPFSLASKIPQPQIAKLAAAIKKVLKDAEKQILKADKDIISGEVRDFLKIHNPSKTHSPTGAQIERGTINSRKTYYTAEQVLYE